MQPISYLVLIPLVCLVFYLVLLLILLGSRRTRVANYYILYVLVMIIWTFGSFMMKTNLPPSHIFWNRILVIGLVGIPTVFYHFSLVLTGIAKQKPMLLIAYLSAGVLLIFNFEGKIIENVIVENNELIYFVGPFAPLVAIYSLIFMLLSFVNILYKVKSNEIPFDRVKYIIFGLFLVIIGALLNLLPSIGKYAIDIILNTVNALFITYSIYRFKFLEIKPIVKKGISYSLYTIILTGLYIVAIFGIQQMLSRYIENNEMRITLGIAVILALVLQPIRNIIQKWIDSIFLKENLDHQTILKDFSQIINNVLDLNELTISLINAVDKGLKPKNVCLLLKTENNYFRVYSSCSADKIQVLQYKDDHPIIKWFSSGKQMLSITEIENSPYFTSLWSKEKKKLYELEMEIMVPIKFREKLIGLLIISEKKRGEAYSKSEIDLLYTLINNAASVIENAKMYEIAKKQAITDGLTQLYNHRYFQELLSKWINEKRYDVFSIAMVDIDLFKIYNDMYGHSEGDRALVKIADVLKKTIRIGDVVVRYGGEEFAIIYPNIVGEDSLKAIEKIRKAVETSFYSSANFYQLLTVSVGVANYPKDGKTAKEVLDCADKAMYMAKQSGRNKAILYSNENVEISKHSSQEDLDNLQSSIQSAYLSSIYALAATIDAKDHYTYGHSENVSNFAVSLAKEAGFSEEKIDIVRNAGLLHDIGKIGIPERILAKTEKLTPDEYDLMKKHVDISLTIIKHVPNLIEVIPAIMTHHERYDGNGYPRKIMGENIPIEGRCLCIVDAFDAMINDRPYRSAFSIEKALEELRRNSGTQFDPTLTDIFIKMVNEGKIDVFEIINLSTIEVSN